MEYDVLRNLARPFENLPMKTVLAAALCMAAVTAVILVFAERYRSLHANARRELKRLKLSEKLLDGNEAYDIREVVLTSSRDIGQARKAARMCSIASICAIASCAALILSLLACWTEWSVMSLARSHGYADGWDASPASLWEDIEKSPREDALPPDLSGCIVLYYKFGCVDCNALGEDLYDTLSSLAPTYRIATRSRAGRKLLERYPVAEVPACVYFKHDGTPLYYVLYEDGPDGTQTDTEALRSLAIAVAVDVASRMAGQAEGEVNIK